MLIDAQNLFSDAQAVTATAVSTNVIDLGADGDLGYTDIRVRAHVQTTFATNTDLTVQVQTSADNSTYTTLFAGQTIPVASLVAGAVLCDVEVPTNTNRYLRLNYVVTGANATAGKIDAFLVMDTPATQLTYKDNTVRF